MRSSRRWALLLGCALLGCALVAPRAAAQRIHLRHYTLDDGLPSTHVRDVTQDASGRLWVATRAGVARYDGREWRTYNLAHGLSWADQLALRWDARGNLWSVSRRAPFHVFRFADERWHRIPGPEGLPPGARVAAFEVLGAEATGDLRLAIATRGDGVYLGDGAGWRRIGRAQGLPDDRVTALVRFGGRLVVATAGGLAAIADGAAAPLPLEPAPPSVAVGLAREGATGSPETFLWLVGEGWIGRLEGDRFVLASADLDRLHPDRESVLAVEPDLQGGLYVGDPEALRYYHPEVGLERLGRAQGLLADGASALLLDREENLWVGSEEGLTKVIDRRFATYAREQGLLADEVTAVLERRGGEIVLGHRGGLSFLSTSGAARTLRLVGRQAADDARRPERVRDLAEDSGGALWVAADSYGLARVDPGGRVAWFGAAEGLPGAVTSVLVDSRGRLWAATDGGLYRRAEAGFERLPAPVAKLHVRRLFEGPSGELLLATAAGLHRYAGGGWSSWTCVGQEGATAACNSVFAVLPRADGSLWAGTSAGLYRSEGEALVPETSLGAAIERPVFFLLRDESGRTWLGTDDGVLRSDGERVEPFTVQDGLAGRETNRAAGLVDARGDVWIGSDRGVTVYGERRPGPRRAPPIVELVAIEASGRRHEPTRPLLLDADDNDLTFHFRAISLLDERRLKIRSRLAGHEPAWRPLESPLERQLRYADLAPGDYRLHLEAANARGLWSGAVVSPPITIARPYWQRPWFLLLALALTAAVGYGVRSHLAQKRTSRRLAAEIAERSAAFDASEARYRLTMTTEKERLAVTLRHIDDGVITTDSDGEIVLMNRKAETVTGWPADEAVGRPLGEVLRLYGAKDDGEPGRPLPLPGTSPDPPASIPAAVLETRAGEHRLVELSGSPIRGPGGEPAGTVLAFRDVTERRRLEEELGRAQRLEALGILAGGIAHDFNNLLTVLLGNLSLLAGAPGLEPRHGRHLADAETAVLRARDLTQQLLTFSRGGAPIKQAASISEVIEQSASFVSSGSKVRCELDLAPELWVVEIDPGQISQVINNLLLNAIQAMPDGGTVRIRGENFDGQPPGRVAPGRYVAIHVEDEGVGIPGGYIGRIFDPYFSTKDEGRGLGLASAYSIVSKHEGVLSVASSPGRGATFSIYLPASEARVLDGEGRGQARPTGGGRVLVMDDDERVREVTGAMLEDLGYEAAYASEGVEALERYREARDSARPFDAVLMDLTIRGGLGGKETVRRLRRLDPEARAIVISGYSNDPVLAQYQDYGFQGRLSKPFPPDELARVLHRVLAAERVDQLA